MKKNYNYNELVRFYNRSLKKLSNLLSLGKNEYKQDILKRRIARLFQLLTGMQTQLKLSTATFALTAGFVLFQPNAANAQSFPAKVTNPFGITASGYTWTFPTLVDLDGDGDKDMMAGHADGGFVYYENTGTASAPAFGAVQVAPFGLTTIVAGYYGTTTFADLDNDGDMDLMSGDGAGDFYYYENNGTATAPFFANPVNNPFGLANIGDTYSSASFIDLDNDGDKDIMAGSKAGNFYYFQNTGTASAPAFGAGAMNSFGLVLTGSAYSTAGFVDIDNDGDKDLFAGRNDGSFQYYKNSGSVTAPAFDAPVLNPFLLVSTAGSGACPNFADLDNDGDMDLISGNSAGSFVYYANAGSTGIAQNTLLTGVNIYPNPTTNNVTLKLNNASEVLSVEVTNVLGQVVSTLGSINESNTINLPEAKGMYFVKVTDAANKSNIFKIVKD